MSTSLKDHSQDHSQSHPQDHSQNIAQEFETLLMDSFANEKKEGQVVKGMITAVDRDSVIVDVGLKSEGRIPKSQFGSDYELFVGKEIPVYIEKFEGKNSRILLSHEKAIRDMAWKRFEENCSSGQRISGSIMGRVKGGFAVRVGNQDDPDSVVAFLPGSQLDIKPVYGIDKLIDKQDEFMIIKIDKANGNIVVSRRAILEEARKGAALEQLSKITEGMVLKGVVKNITDYAAFIDLGCCDGLLHITDMSWSKISHPSEMVTIGQHVEVQVTKFQRDAGRISLGMKQLQPNPWHNLSSKYQVGMKLKGVVCAVIDCGALVRIGDGIEGLVYHTEMDWNSKNASPRKLAKVGDEVDVMILNIDVEKHRMSLSMKQCKPNPWHRFSEEYPVGSKVSGTIKNIATFGIFMTVGDDEEHKIDVLIPANEIDSDLTPEEALKKYNKGDKVTGVVLAIVQERERVTVSLRRGNDDALTELAQKLIEEGITTCVVSAIKKDGIEVKVNDQFGAFIKRGDLSRDKGEQRPERFAIGDKIDSKVLGFDKNTGKLLLSIRALEIEKEKRAIEEYGSVASGASLSDILGGALKKENSNNS